MYFQLNIITSNNTICDIWIQAPSSDLLQYYIDNVGDDGYKLFEIISVLLPDVQSITISGMSSDISQCNTVIDWKYIQP